MTFAGADPYGTDLYTEPDGVPDTLSQLGPLGPLAGVWEGVGGADEHPVTSGTELDEYVERYELQPIDRQTNGPQLLYGLRYHVHITKPGETETFHDQVGYWLWEPATHTVTLTLGIPRGQVLLAGGTVEPGATHFEVQAAVGSKTYGILSNPFLDQAFRTVSYRMQVTAHRDGTWSYEQDSVLDIAGRPEPFHHTDRNTLRRVAPPTPNPLARAAGRSAPARPGRNADDSLGIGALHGQDSIR